MHARGRPRRPTATVIEIQIHRSPKPRFFFSLQISENRLALCSISPDVQGMLDVREESSVLSPFDDDRWFDRGVTV